MASGGADGRATAVAIGEVLAAEKDSTQIEVRTKETLGDLRSTRTLTDTTERVRCS